MVVKDTHLLIVSESVHLQFPFQLGLYVGFSFVAGCVVMTVKLRAGGLLTLRR